MAYCMYLRKSRKDREAEMLGAGETLAAHRKILTELANQNRHVIEEEYHEIVSGETISERPEMRRLLADVMAGKWEGVYVTEVERLARGDTKDQGMVANAFKFSDTLIITPSRTFNPNNDADEEYFEFGLFMSRREYKTITRRQQAGRKQAVNDGKFLASTPAYGYKKVKLPGKGWSLEIVPEEAQTVKNIFRWYADGQGLAQIAGRLNAEAGEFIWIPKRIMRLLENEVYIGKIRWGKEPYKKVLIDGEIVKKRIKSKEYQLADGLHDAIISDNLWNAVQAARKTRKKVPTKISHDVANPLAGLVVCSECGRKMQMRAPTGYQPEYLCCVTPNCKCVRSYLHFIEESVLSALASWRENYALPQRPEMQQSDDLQERIRAASVKKDKLAAQLKKVQTLLETDVYTVEEYAVRSAEIKADIKKATETLDSLQIQAKSIPRYVTYEQIAPYVNTLLDLFQTLDAGRKNDLLKQCISKIVYTKTQKGGRYVRPDLFSLDIYPAIID